MSVFLRMDRDHEIPDLTYKTSRRDKVSTRKIEETTRPGSIWLEAWMHLSKTQKRRGIPDWEEEHARLQAARCNKESTRLRQKNVTVDHLYQSNQKKSGNSFMRRLKLKSSDLVCFSRRVIRSRLARLKVYLRGIPLHSCVAHIRPNFFDVQETICSSPALRCLDCVVGDIP